MASWRIQVGLKNSSADLKEINSNSMQHDLVDEYRLMVFLIVLGKGKRLFMDGSDTNTLRLVEVKPVGSGVLILIYHPQRKK
jgi:dihydrofolate reductase